MESVRPLSPVTDYVAISPGLLKAREIELDNRILRRPEVVAQAVQVELIKLLRRDCPWLLPISLKLTQK